MVSATCEAVGLQATGRDLGINWDLERYVDAKAALGIIQRSGLGKVRHLRTQALRLQEVAKEGRGKLLKVDGSVNPADACTKYLTEKNMDAHMLRLGVRYESGGRLQRQGCLRWWSGQVIVGVDIEKGEGEMKRIVIMNAIAAIYVLVVMICLFIIVIVVFHAIVFYTYLKKLIIALDLFLVRRRRRAIPWANDGRRRYRVFAKPASARHASAHLKFEVEIRVVQRASGASRRVF